MQSADPRLSPSLLSRTLFVHLLLLLLCSFPYLTLNASPPFHPPPRQIYTGHSSHVLCARFLELPQAQAHPQTQAVGLVVSVGGNDCSCQQWAVKPEPARLAR